MIAFAILIVCAMVMLKMLTLKAWFLALVCSLPVLFVAFNYWIERERIKAHSDSRLVLNSLPTQSILATCLGFSVALALLFSVSNVLEKSAQFQTLCIVTFFLVGLFAPFYYSKYLWTAKTVRIAGGMLSVGKHRVPVHVIKHIGQLECLRTKPYHSWFMPSLIGLNVYEIHFHTHTPMGTSVVCIAPVEENFDIKLEFIVMMGVQRLAQVQAEAESRRLI